MVNEYLKYSDLSERQITSAQYIANIHEHLCRTHDIKEAYFLADIICHALSCMNKSYGTIDTNDSEYDKLMMSIGLIRYFHDETPYIVFRDVNGESFHDYMLCNIMSEKEKYPDIFIEASRNCRVAKDGLMSDCPNSVLVEIRKYLASLTKKYT